MGTEVLHKHLYFVNLFIGQPIDQAPSYWSSIPYPPNILGLEGHGPTGYDTVTELGVESTEDHIIAILHELFPR